MSYFIFEYKLIYKTLEINPKYLIIKKKMDVTTSPIAVISNYNYVFNTRCHLQPLNKEKRSSKLS